MPKLKPDTQRARREHILDAAELCFARAGFHRTTMHDICAEASISPGALYVYFSSKEDLIAGITERDRAKLAGQLTELANAPDLMAALAKLGEHYAIEEPKYKSVLCIEMGCEATRNPVVGEIYRSVDNFCIESFKQLFARARADGKIAPKLETAIIAQVIAVIGDGLFWRRAVDPNFDGATLIPVIVDLMRTILNPVADASAEASNPPAANEAAE